MYALAFDANSKKCRAEFVIDVLVEGLGVGDVVVSADFQLAEAARATPPYFLIWARWKASA